MGPNVRATLMDMARALPFEVRYSGGGYHVVAQLKETYEPHADEFSRAEQLRTELTRVLCGDPAPNHNAALLRVVGTHNTKYGDSRAVEVISEGRPVDLTEVEAFLELYPDPVFAVKEEYTAAAGGGDTHDAPHAPIDYDAVLLDMPTTPEGVNEAQPRLLRALIVRDGRTPQEAIDMVVAATMDMSAVHHPEWTLAREVKDVTERVKSVLSRLQREHWGSVESGTSPTTPRRTGFRLNGSTLG
jgi:hypothetical protein